MYTYVSIGLALITLDSDIKVMAKQKKKDKYPKKTQVISFRVTEEIFRDLLKYSATQKDELGSPLNVTSAARRLMLAALQDFNKGE